MTRKGSLPTRPTRYALRRRFYQTRELTTSKTGQPGRHHKPTADKAAEENAAAPAISPEELQQLREMFTRQRAEFDNFRKRTEREKEQVRELAAEGLLTRLLPVIDNLERALASADSAADVASVRNGVAMIVSQLERALESEGLQQVKALNEPFDPSVHDALAAEPHDEVPDGHIFEVLLPGYLYKEKLLRPAMVKVSRKA